ncbi:MAG: four helix bundle protein [Patescibacteria group bacterium]
MENAGYRKLNVYLKAHELVLRTYKATREFPKQELFGLISQMRRAVISVVANIVEGYSRRTPNNKLQFYYIARGSLTELEYYIDLSYELGYLPEADYKNLQEILGDVGQLLNGFIKSIK